jgi:hypothetical protein
MELVSIEPPTAAVASRAGGQVFELALEVVRGPFVGD